ncbi:MAG TPA: hypothetical protein DEH25_13215 [Chloroflexi bacterium]|nr:hypothetical protein [Chloroflexota bacterium]
MSTVREATIPISLGYGDYFRFSKLIYEKFGLSFSTNRQTDFERGVRQAFAASTCADFNEYYNLLLDPEKGLASMEQLVNALTVGESHFFRNKAQFDALYDHILPQIIKRRQALRNIRIWSAGCAGGEEPYSLAIMLRELLPNVDEWSVTILATDINTQALDRARKGVYGNWAFREERAKHMRSQYFEQHDQRYELSPQIRQMVTFKQLNLADDQYPSYETNTMFMDLVLCRNVMIYFSEPVTRAIVDRFYDTVIDGGWLAVGHSEHSMTVFSKFKAHNFPEAILYQRTSQVLDAQFEWPAPPKQTPLMPPPPVAAPPSRVANPFNERFVNPTAPKITVPATNPVQTTEPENPIEYAKELIEFGQAKEAQQLLLDLLKKEPANALACALLGRVYANQGDWQKAEHWCAQALKSNKLTLEAYYTMALVLQHTNRLPQAIEAMKRVVYINHNHILGHFGLADLYHANQQIPQALKSLDNVQRLLGSQRVDELIPDSGGITVKRLQQSVTRQLQEWGAEAK